MNNFKNDEPSFASYGHLVEEAKFLAILCCVQCFSC